MPTPHLFHAARRSTPDTAMEVTAAEVEARRRSGAPQLLVDVREPSEYVGPLGHIPGARLIPLGALGARLGELTSNQGAPLVLVCRSGARSLSAAAALRRAGVAEAVSLAGGMIAWNDEGYEVARGS